MLSLRSSFLGLLVVAGLALTVALAPRPSAAADRVAVQGTDLALVTGPRTGGVQHMGLAIGLADHWKTYWRNPGDAGIPPSLDWSASDNVAAVTVGFPAPERFGTDGLNSIGYLKPVVLTLDVRLADPNKAATLRLGVLVGLCKDICIPAEAKLEAPLAADAPASAVLAEAAERVPQPVTTGAPLSVVRVTRDAATKPESVVAEIAAPAETAGLDVFVEGPEGWALPLPEREGDRDGHTLWRFALDGLPGKATITGARLRFTVVTAKGAAEQSVELP